MLKYSISQVGDILKLIIMLFLIAYVGFKSNGISGVFINFKNLGYIVLELLKFLNIVSVNINGDGILTGFFLYYIGDVVRRLMRRRSQTGIYPSLLHHGSG